MMTAPLPVSAARAVALHAQNLAAAPDSAATADAICSLVEQLGCVQIDTLQMVRRSHYLVIWSRLGSYDPALFDQLIYDPGQRRLFEYWQHAASIIPLKHYRCSLPIMRYYQDGGGNRNKRWLADAGNAALMQEVFEIIRREGGKRAADFEHDGARRGSWWDWKPAKRALEVLFDRGELMIANRVNFQRVYDLPERVLPDWVDTSDPTPDEANRQTVITAVKALGICKPVHAADYAYMRRTVARPIVEALLAEGICIPVETELADGSTDTWIVHRDYQELVTRAADGDLKAVHTTFLSPFDSLFWTVDRDVALWNFRQVLEAYKPEGQREWGYFCLPILHQDRLIGRFDPKLERKTGTLRLKALHLEPGIQPDEAMVAAVAGAMRDFMRFHDAADLVVEKSDPPGFGQRLQQAM